MIQVSFCFIKATVSLFQAVVIAILASKNIIKVCVDLFHRFVEQSDPRVFSKKYIFSINTEYDIAKTTAIHIV